MSFQKDTSNGSAIIAHDVWRTYGTGMCINVRLQKGDSLA